MTESPAMTVLTDVADRVQPQDNSIVSTRVLKADGARIVAFAFDEAEVLSEHTAAVPILLQVPQGRLAITADGRTVELTSGSWIHIAARIPHSVEALEPSKMILTLLGS